MRETLIQLLSLKEKGYFNIEYHDEFIVAQKKENGKYYIIDGDLQEISGSESDQIKVVERECIFLVQDGSVNTISWRGDEYPVGMHKIPFD